MLQEVGSQLDPARTHLLGKVPYEDYRRILQVSAAHVYLTCSFVLSGSMLKAMATGCLVIGSDTAPAREMLVDDVDGWLVNACDRRDIVSKALECLDAPATTASAIRGEAMKAAHAGYGVQAGVAAFSQLCLGGSISLQEVSRAA
ncbi:MAG: glycosyltransferase [Comamonadaceae bacterium]|nr:glycosyltransferase [Comamonadaceae bacterium]